MCIRDSTRLQLELVLERRAREQLRQGGIHRHVLHAQRHVLHLPQLIRVVHEIQFRLLLDLLRCV